MAAFWPSVLQLGLPDIVTDLVGIAGTVVLLLIFVALGAYVYKSLTGGIEWPSDTQGPPGEESNEEELREGRSDEEWEYY
ncbi:MAG: hypothetical protein R3324_13115 [Halobacteriales archaeon]|nr:hypothetical protein [Halobacteriales archaeon]